MKFDGTESNELWKLDPSERMWTLIESIHVPVERGNEAVTRGLHEAPHGEVGSASEVPSNNVLFEDDHKILNRIDNHLNSDDHLSSSTSDTNVISSSSFVNQCSSMLCFPLACSGHASVVVEDRLLVIFGHSSFYGPLSVVQEFHFSK